MSMKFLCRIDSKHLVLQESGGKTSSWVQIFRKGEWKHPKYGPLKFTDEIFNGFIKNFTDRVRKVDIAIDAEHEPEKGACGWVKQLEDVQTPDAERTQPGLWALVEWTARGLQLVADGAFKYLSGDFDYEWKDEESGRKYKNVLFGAALTNRPFIKGMSPINLSDFREELEKDEDVRGAMRLAEELLKLKEGDKVMKTDAEIMAVKDEADLLPEELARKKELIKADEEAKVQLKKKELAERAKKVNLAEDAAEADIIAAEKKLADDAATEALKKRAKAVGLPETATEAEIAAKEKELCDSKRKLAERAKKVNLAETATLAEIELAEKKLQEKVIPENEQKVKMAIALGLSADATTADIEAAAAKCIAAVRAIEGAPTLAERAKKIGLAETATESEVELKEKELSDKKLKEDIDALLASDVPTLEKKLAEMKTQNADALTVKLLEDSISSKKKLHEEQIKNSKEKIELKLKEHFRSGKLTKLEHDTLKVILCSEVETGETSFKLSEKDKDGKDVEATKTLSEIIDGILTERPAIVELKEIAKKELSEPPKDKTKELAEGEATEVGTRVARKVTGSSKTAKQLAERAKKAGLPATATLAEIELAEKKGK